MSDYHSSIRQSWDANAAQGWGEDGRPAPEFEELFQAHRKNFGPRVLDIGAGKGRYVILLAGQGFDVTGVDISAGMISSANHKLAEAGVNATMIQGQSSHLEFPDQSFDSVVSVGAIHHNMWEDIQRSFQEASRVLKPGAVFIFQGRSDKDTTARREQIKDRGLTAIDLEGSKTGNIQHYFSLQELQELAQQNNFKIIGEPKEVLEVDENQSEKIRARWWVVFKKQE